MILVFLGPPGSGKGTQAKRLTAIKHWPQLSTGDMLRTAIQNKTELGRIAKTAMDKGELVSDETVIKLIAERMQAPDCRDGFILDGFPRTIPQAESLEKFLKNAGKTVDRAILFDIEDQVLVDRLSGRRTCSQCQAMYHVQTLKPKKDGVCDKCGAALVQRDDDQAQVIQKRLKVYRDQTAPLMGFYRNLHKLETINADMAPEKVEAALLSYIN